MAAQGDGVPQRGDKGFAIGTDADMAANFSTDVRGELVVDVGRQLLEQIQATAWLMRMWRRRPRRGFRMRCCFLGHVCDPLDSFAGRGSL